MSKSTGKKITAKSRASESKLELTGSSGQEDEKIGGVLKSRQLSFVEQQAKSPCLGLKEEADDKFGLKRNYDDDADEIEDYGLEMSSLMKAFGSGMAKTMSAKKRRVESLTTGTMKANLKMVVEPWGKQLDSGMEMVNDMYKLATSILDQTDADSAKMKKEDENMIKLFQQQMKSSVQNRNAMLQRNAACRQVMDSYLAKVKEQDAKNREELNTMQYDLKRELGTMQKKILNESQKEEMENVKKNLTKMFYAP